MRAVAWFIFAVWAVVCAKAQYTGTNTTVRALTSASTIKPGEEVTVAFHFRMQPDWHVYWVNPGEAGQAISVKWKLPPGFTASPLQWPPPEKINTEGLITYGYHGETTLLATLRAAENAEKAQFKIGAELEWQECKTLCLLAKTNLAIEIIIGGETVPSPAAGVVAAAKEQLPIASHSLNPRAQWNGAATKNEREIALRFTPPTPNQKWDWYPFAVPEGELEGATRADELPNGDIRLKKKLTIYGEGWPTNVGGLLVQLADENKPVRAYEFSAKIQGSAQAVAVGALDNLPPSPAAAQSLLAMLITAFLGGLILNIMPCVLPVISLKILGFVQQSAERPARVRQLGFIYGLGVLVSFLILAGLVIAVKLAGNNAIWGMQFQNPVFVVALITLITLVALNLFGVFEITLGGSALTTAGTLASKEGASGAFFNGVLTTALATPCSAPFLGAALGFAFTQRASVIILVFSFIAFGLAFPYVLLTSKPEWMRFLPRAGPWMVRFKQLMGFPMMATAFWLLDIALGLFGSEQIFWLGLFVTMVAVAAYIWGEFAQKGVRPLLSRAIALLLAVGSYFLILERQLHWRNPAPPESLSAAAGIEDFQTGVWVPWSPGNLAKARALGRPILVDFTARSCLTCKRNKKFVIDTEKVQQRMKELDVITMKADFTTADPVIAEELLRFGRAGVPMVLVYPSDSNAPPQLLPEWLTVPGVLQALDQAGGAQNLQTSALAP